MSRSSGHAALDLAAIGPARVDGFAAAAAMAAARGGGTVAFIDSDACPRTAAFERSMQQAGVLVRAGDSSLLLVRAGRTLLVESSLWQSEAGQGTARRSAAIARAARRQIVLALTDAATIHRRRHGLLAFLRSHVDLLLCSPLEACALYDTHRVDTVVPLIRRDCPVAVLDRGDRGLILVDDGGVRLLDVAPMRGADGAFAGALILAQPWGRDLLESCRLAGGLAAATAHRRTAVMAPPRIAAPSARLAIGVAVPVR
jgi:sugar/nucleoside kinase (ribokinase family)